MVEGYDWISTYFTTTSTACPAEHLPAYNPLWALQGYLPGLWQCMEPTTWKNGRHVMLADATAEAREELAARRQEVLLGPVEGGDGDVSMNLEGEQPLPPTASASASASVPTLGVAVEPPNAPSSSVSVPV